MSTSPGQSYYPCTCGHEVNEHSLVHFPTVAECDVEGCLCRDYREDLLIVIYSGAITWMDTSPEDEQVAFAAFCLDYYQDEDDLSHVNYRTAWSEYLDVLNANA